MTEVRLQSNSWTLVHQYLDEANKALQANEPEQASQFMFNATDAALRCLAESRNEQFDTRDQQIEFVQLLDRENGNERFYVEHLLLGQYFADSAQMGVERKIDLNDYMPMTADFVAHLQRLSEAKA